MKLTGISGARGISIGKAFVHASEDLRIHVSHIIEAEKADEQTAFLAAVATACEQISRIRDKALRKMGEENARIFDAHLMLAQDPAFADDVTALINEENYSAAAAVKQVVEQYAALFAEMEDEYMRERGADIQDVGARILRVLLSLPPQELDQIQEEVILIAHDLTPSDTASLEKQFIKGFATAIGGPTSHAAIIARTLEIPAVLGLGAIDSFQTGDTIILDGVEGSVIINPSPEEIAIYTQSAADFRLKQEELKSLAHLPAVTLDGKTVELAANISSAADVPAAIDYGAEGVGLFRTEFLYMNRSDLPDEETQFAAYRQAVEALQGRPLIIRTMDAGGDKETACLGLSPELNPFLGYRAIRICLDRLAIFKTQLRAIIRASAFGPVLLMYPMISGMSEVRRANAILEEVKAELRANQIPFDETIKKGIMIEIPSAALMADSLIKEVDFFSIGTNDLCQYTLAVDRMNEKISRLYQPLHPAVLRLIKHTITSSHEDKKFTGMCGELAGDPLATLILLGLGLDEFSMSASSIPLVKKIIRSVTVTEAAAIAKQALAMETPEEIAAFAAAILKEKNLL